MTYKSLLWNKKLKTECNFDHGNIIEGRHLQNDRFFTAMPINLWNSLENFQLDLFLIKVFSSIRISPLGPLCILKASRWSMSSQSKDTVQERVVLRRTYCFLWGCTLLESPYPMYFSVGETSLSICIYSPFFSPFPGMCLK